MSELRQVVPTAFAHRADERSDSAIAPPERIDA
jgi:hypothetical protein